MDIREAQISDAQAIARVHVDSWRTTYSGIVPADYLAQLDYRQREQDWRGWIGAKREKQFIYVAQEEGKVVGFAWGGPERSGSHNYDAELYVIYVLETHQRKGLGRLLVSHVACRLLEEGMASMLVWVLADNPYRQFYERLADNPYRQFYERLGGTPVAEQPISIGGAQLKEVAYGWPDLQLLAGMAGEC